MERDRESPVARESPKDARPGRDQSPISTGRGTPTQHPSKLSAKAMEAGEAAPLTTPARQRSLRQHRQRASLDSADESVLSRHGSLDGSIESRSYRNSRNLAEEPKSPKLSAHQEALIKELEAAKYRNAWYASELALAKKAGYSPNPSSNPTLDERAADAFADEDRPLIEAFLAMRAELAKMQATVDRQAAIASKRVAEVEHQRDAALSEAAYARAKLAAHGGSQRGTPQLDGPSRDGNDPAERTAEMSRKLAVALAAQADLRAKVDALTTELQQEKRARELAEETCEATRKRLAELEMQNNSLELESLRAELHRAESTAREESLLRIEAESALRQMTVDKEELAQKIEASSSQMKEYGDNLTALRDAVAASSTKATLLERQLEEERERREGLERKLLHLRSEHEERSSELENAMRRLREAEELAESHMKEAETHRKAFLAGLERASSVNSDASMRSLADQRVAALEAQVERASKLAKANQAAADAAADKLRRAEERIAGLEAYQEQTSREGLQLRRQLQAAMKEGQATATENRELRAQLESQQRDTSALAIQHSALKDLLGERGLNASDSRRSPLLESPGSRFGTPEQSRLRELEQQLSASLKAHEELKASFEAREQEADRAYREKLEQLENDYQSAVHYVKGTEKMLKRMKEELTRYKSQNAQVQSELEAAQRDLERSSSRADVPADWQAERSNLQKSIADVQHTMKASIADLESQISTLKQDLFRAQAETDKSRAEVDEAHRQLEAAAEKTRAELEQLKQENSLLESRAMDAEQKVTMLLDQVEASVGNYRRHSQHVPGLNGISRTHSNASSNTIGGLSARPRANSNLSISQDDSFLDNRGSMALDSLANELEALRTHWESTNRNYRLSTQLDLDRTPTKESSGGAAAMAAGTATTSGVAEAPGSGEGGLSSTVADWRRRLDDEDADADTVPSSTAAAGLEAGGKI